MNDLFFRLIVFIYTPVVHQIINLYVKIDVSTEVYKQKY